MAEPLCALCPNSADVASITPPVLRFLCHQHSTPGFLVQRSSAPLFAVAVQLAQNTQLAEQFWSIFTALPDKIAQELSISWGIPKDLSRFRALASPEDVILLKDRNRLLRFLRKAGLRLPNALIPEARSEQILVKMIKSRISINVIQDAFERWPCGNDKFKVLGSLVKNPHSQFEKKLLIELLLPHYLGLTLGKDTSRSVSVVGRLKDEKLKQVVISYIRYLQNIYVLKATEICTVTRRLPKPLRRYIVEVFICAF